jgi:hypothetical protein
LKPLEKRLLCFQARQTLKRTDDPLTARARFGITQDLLNLIDAQSACPRVITRQDLAGHSHFFRRRMSHQTCTKIRNRPDQSRLADAIQSRRPRDPINRCGLACHQSVNGRSRLLPAHRIKCAGRIALERHAQTRQAQANIAAHDLWYRADSIGLQRVQSSFQADRIGSKLLSQSDGLALQIDEHAGLVGPQSSGIERTAIICAILARLKLWIEAGQIACLCGCINRAGVKRSIVYRAAAAGREAGATSGLPTRRLTGLGGLLVHNARRTLGDLIRQATNGGSHAPVTGKAGQIGIHTTQRRAGV